jgi:hypothetical protein
MKRGPFSTSRSVLNFLSCIISNPIPLLSATKSAGILIGRLFLSVKSLEYQRDD